MAFENLVISEIGLLEILKVVLLIVLGVVIAAIVKFFLVKLAKITLYPWIRQHTPGSYKRTRSTINLVANIIQWTIIILFVFQALSVFKIYLLEEILKLSINFIPKLAIALLIIAIGLIITGLISRKIKDMEFKNSYIFSKIFEVVFISATILSALEAVNIRVTPFVEIFKVGLYSFGLAIAIAIGIGVGFALRPQITKIVNNLKK